MPGLDPRTRRFRDVLGAVADADARLFDGPGTTVVGEEGRAGSSAASAYCVGAHTLVRCDPAVADRVRHLLVDGPATTIDLDRFEELLRPVAETMHGRGLVHIMRDLTEMRPGGPAADVQVIDRIADRRLIADLVAVDEEGADEAEIDLDGLDDRIVGIVEGGVLVAYASECPWDSDAAFADIGVMTHPDHRGRRLGHAVVAAVTEAIEEAGRIPMYRCNVDNAASHALSQAVGFSRVAVLAAVSLLPS
ncbi:MAG: GNAT family N-acetyltransferase [Actinomycetota bacterium]